MSLLGLRGKISLSQLRSKTFNACLLPVKSLFGIADHASGPHEQEGQCTGLMCRRFSEDGAEGEEELRHYSRPMPQQYHVAPHVRTSLLTWSRLVERTFPLSRGTACSICTSFAPDRVALFFGTRTATHMQRRRSSPSRVAAARVQGISHDFPPWIPSQSDNRLRCLSRVINVIGPHERG